MKPISILATALLTTSFGSAYAASSDWFAMEGASIRLVTTGKPDASGMLRGVLDIELKPGWKTYWRDPGDAGVPPTIDVSASRNLAGAELDFPAPQRHDEGDFQWAGYDYPVGLPVTFRIREGETIGPLEANIFLGVCETICVPVQATLKIEPDRDFDNRSDKAAVERAFAAVPQAATPEFGVRVTSEPGSHAVVLEARFPGDPATAELFVAGDQGYTFTTPVREQQDGKTIFTTTVTLPAKTGTGPGLHYTLVTDAGAVNGLLPYF